MADLKEIERHLEDAHSALQFWAARDEDQPEAVTEALIRLDDALKLVRAGLSARKETCLGCERGWPLQGTWHVEDLGRGAYQRMQCIALSAGSAPTV